MVRRWAGNMNGEQFLGNAQRKVVHDLDRESDRCLIAETIGAGHDVPFEQVADALRKGYDRCDHCLSANPSPTASR